MHSDEAATRVEPHAARSPHHVHFAGHDALVNDREVLRIRRHAILADERRLECLQTATRLTPHASRQLTALPFGGMTPTGGVTRKMVLSVVRTW